MTYFIAVWTPLENKAVSSTSGISVAYENGKPDHFLFVFEGVANYMRYSKNILFHLNFLFGLVYYLLLVLGFSQLKKAWLRNLVRRQQTERDMQNLQMQTVMNQLNPHFTYNAINTVGAAILNNEPKKAYENLTQVSRLIRKSVDHTFEPSKTLGQEIEFVRDYLEIEKLRFGERLNYEVNVEKSVDLNIRVPKMLIQLFAENAVKHGLFHKPEGGSVIINIISQQETIKITVEDNGIGRKKAVEKNSGKTGKGMIILRNYLNLFKEQFNLKISFEHYDVSKNGEVCGTRVEILIQL